jgi:hypothetical protein
MRTSIVLAGLLLLVGASAKAQDSGPGFFGFDPKLITGPNVTRGQNHFPIPNRTLTQTTFDAVGAFISKFKAPFGEPTYPTTTLPTYSPLMPQSYLKAFHYLPPGTVSK